VRKGNQILGDLIEGLYECDTLEQQFLVFNRCIQSLGFESCAYTFIPSVVLNPELSYAPIFVKSDTFSESFLDQYIVDRFDGSDFTLRAIKDNKLHPMIWEEMSKSDYLTEKEKKVLNIAKKDHGILDGISIPVMNESIGIAGFSITNSIKDNHVDILETERIKTLQLCAQAFHDIVFSRPYRYHEFIPSSLRDLTSKERIVLEFISSGRTMKELGESREPISKRYGEKLLLELREKFGGITTHELIRHASQMRII
jgi:DNA-binding CsgD family transcriptional regulator